MIDNRGWKKETEQEQSAVFISRQFANATSSIVESVISTGICPLLTCEKEVHWLHYVLLRSVQGFDKDKYHLQRIAASMDGT